MPDLYCFPHLSRLFYMENTPLHHIYTEINLQTNYPSICAWFKKIREDPRLQKELIPPLAFKKWIDELMTLPDGKKPALRLPHYKL